MPQLRGNEPILGLNRNVSLTQAMRKRLEVRENNSLEREKCPTVSKQNGC
jgi:hypothetical protein